MEHIWWYAGIKCPKCEGDPVHQSTAYSADGELRFTYYCVKCKELVHWRVYATALALRALMNDMERNTPVEPAKQLPKKSGYSDQDKKEAHDLGISLEGE